MVKILTHYYNAEVINIIMIGTMDDKEFNKWLSDLKNINISSKNNKDK